MIGAELRCKACGQYTPDRCTCRGLSPERVMQLYDEAIDKGGSANNIILNTVWAAISEVRKEIPRPDTGSHLDSEDAWEAHKAKLRVNYPGIGGEFKVFEVVISTESGCKIADGEYSLAITRLIGGTVGEDDFDLILDAVAEEIGGMALPEEGQTPVIVYESGERQDVFWHKYYRIVGAADCGEPTKPEGNTP